MRRFIAAVAVLVLAGATGAQARPSLTSKYQHAYWQVVRMHGKPAAGRNIINRGYKAKGKPARPATKHEKAKSLRQLRRLAHPWTIVVPVPPAQPPSAVMATSSTSSLAQCIIRVESGGNTQARNGQYTGIAQWSPTIWARDGGLRYASSPTGASFEEQVAVLNYGLAHHGCGDWCPYDPC
jgi:hypothetical protein